MAQQSIDLGSVSLDGTGTPVREAGDMVNDNFTELYEKTAAIYDVTEFGDVGTSNDSDTFNAAIVAVNAAGGGVINIPEGTYLLADNDYLAPKNNVILRGAGMDRTILKGTSTMLESVVKGTTFSADSPLTRWGMDGLTVDCEDMPIVGTPGSTVASGGKGVFIIWQRDCHYRDVKILGSPSTGMGNDFHQRCSYTNCIVEGCGFAMRTSTTSSSYPHIDAYGVGCHGFGIGYCGWDDDEVVFQNCQAINNWNAGYSCERVTPDEGSYETGQQYRRSTKMVLLNCIGTGNRYGAELNTLRYRSEVHGFDIIGGKFANNLRDGILMYYMPMHANVIGAHVFDNGWNGISCPTSGMTDTGTDVTISNCHIWGHQSDGNSEYEGWGILASNDNTLIQGNHIHRNYRGGILCTNMDDEALVGLNVSRNIIYNNGLANTNSADGVKLLLADSVVHRNLYVDDNLIYDDGDVDHPSNRAYDYVSITDEVCRIEFGQGHKLYAGEKIDVSGYTGDQTDANITGATITAVTAWTIEYAVPGASDLERVVNNEGSEKVTRLASQARGIQWIIATDQRNVGVRRNTCEGMLSDGIRLTHTTGGTTTHMDCSDNQLHDNAAWGLVVTFNATDCEKSKFAQNHADGNSTGNIIVQATSGGEINTTVFTLNQYSATFTANGGADNVLDLDGDISDLESKTSWTYHTIADGGGGSQNLVIKNATADTAARIHFEPTGYPSGTHSKLDFMADPYDSQDGTIVPSAYRVLTFAAKDDPDGVVNSRMTLHSKSANGQRGVWPSMDFGFNDGTHTMLRMFYFDVNASQWYSPMLGAWRTGRESIAIDDYCISGNYIYKATTAGTTGETAPTHTSSTASDGGVTWEYVIDWTDGASFKTRTVVGSGLPTFGFADVGMEFESEVLVQASSKVNVELGGEISFLDASGDPLWKLYVSGDQLRVENVDTDDSIRFDSGDNAMQFAGIRETSSSKILTNPGTAVDISDTRLVRLNNSSGAANWASITNGKPYQYFAIEFGDANTTILNSTSLKLLSGGNEKPAAGDIKHFMTNSAGTAAKEFGVYNSRSPKTLTNPGTALNISNAKLIRLDNSSGAANWESITGGKPYWDFYVEFADANTTIVHHATSLVLRSGGNENPAAGTIKYFMTDSAGTAVKEL